MSGFMLGAEATGNPYKRPASPASELPMPPAKVPKTGTGQLQINYLKREKKETIPLATSEEPLPRLLRLISEYDGVLQRHESLAGNLGACPVGPILLKRFERLFEGPPRILKSNSRDPNITWLDVVEFAQNKPEQFDLEKTRNGVRVCQFYLKQCRVEISEEDYVLIRSGMPQKLIPPQPILEDEEKELGVIEVLDRNLAKVVHSADQVSARARQLVHRLKNRRAAILARREAEGDAPRTILKSNDMPTSPAFDHNGALTAQSPMPPKPASHTNSPSMPSSGFTAVNNRHSISSVDMNPFHSQREPQQIQSPLQSQVQPQAQVQPHQQLQSQPPPPPQHQHQPQQQRAQQPPAPPQQQQQHHHEPSINGTPSQTPSHPLAQQPPEPPKQEQQQQQPSTSEAPSWIDRFLTPRERAAGMTADTVRRELPSIGMMRTPSERAQDEEAKALIQAYNSRRRDDTTRRQSESTLPEKPASSVSSDPQGPSVPIPNTPASLMPQQKPHTWNRDDGGPYKAEMISRMETMKRGERVIPPCDRCRRLHMDCIKNLTACLGCTKKHAKCSWKDVSLEELDSTAPAARDRVEKDNDPAVPSSSEWDNMLKKTKTSDSSEQDRASPASAPPTEQAEDSSNKGSTSRVASPPQNGATQPTSHPNESPRLDVRPPPLDQQLRDAAEDRPHTMSPFARYSPFNRPLSRQQPPHSAHKDEPIADNGDRLAAIASQVYRTASQNTTRAQEGRAETAS